PRCGEVSPRSAPGSSCSGPETQPRRPRRSGCQGDPSLFFRRFRLRSLLRSFPESALRVETSAEERASSDLVLYLDVEDVVAPDNHFPIIGDFVPILRFLRVQENHIHVRVDVRHSPAVVKLALQSDRHDFVSRLLKYAEWPFGLRRGLII